MLEALPGDADALRCLAAAQLQDGAIEAAWGTLQQLPDGGGGQEDALLRGYALYRLERGAEGLAALEGLEGRASRELRAQILHQLGRHTEAAEAYQALLKGTRGKAARADLCVNLVAELVNGGQAAAVPDALQAAGVAARDSMEVAFNAACASLATGALEDADFLLEQALAVGKEVLAEEGLDDREIDQDLAPVEVQRGYLRSRQGDPEAATALYSDLFHKQVDDPKVQAVLTNNYASLRGTLHVTDSLKKFEKVLSLKKLVQARGRPGRPGDGDKIPPALREDVYSNLSVLCMYANKLDYAEAVAEALRQLAPASDKAAILLAGIKVQKGKSQDAEVLLDDFIQAHPEAAVDAQLAKAQLALAAGNARNARDLLLQFSFQPAVIASAVALCERLGDPDGALAAVEKAIGWWREQEDSPAAVTKLLAAAASLSLKFGREEEAVGKYEELLALKPGIQELASGVRGLVAASGGACFAIAEEIEAGLEPIPGLDGLDAELLEQSAGGLVSRQQDAEAADDWISTTRLKGKEKRAYLMKTLPPDQVQAILDRRRAKNKRKRQRHKRLPQNHAEVPADKQDPERWLPKHERAAYRKKKRAKDVGKGGQGAGKVDNKLDVSQMEAKPAGVSLPARPKQGKQGKKKGKGKKGRR